MMSSNFVTDAECMQLARSQQPMSRDPKTQVGACLRSAEGVIIGVGYNCMPADKDSAFTWWDEKNTLNSKHWYVSHAEMNAIVDAYQRNAAAVANSTLFCTIHPDNECAKLIARAGIKRVVYESNKHGDKMYTKAAVRIFAATQIVCEPLL